MKVFSSSSLVYLLTPFPTSTSLCSVTTTTTVPLPLTRSQNTQLFLGGGLSEMETPRSTSPIERNSNSEEIESSSSSSSFPLLSQLLPPLQPNTRRIYLIRHGETDWNLQGRIQGGGHDIPLNANGKSQAKAVAKALHDIPLTVICSSTLSRAKETADILWQDHPKVQHRELDSGLREMGFGEFEGLEIHNLELDEKIRNRFKTITRQVNENPEMAFPGGGECTRMVEERACRALQTLLDKYPNDPHIAVVSHGRTNKVLIASIALGDVQKFRTVKQKNTAINVLDVDSAGNWTIRILDYIEHVKDNVIIR